MALLVIRQRVLALAHLAGRVWTAIEDGAPITIMAKRAIRRANVKRTIRKCAIRGRANVIVRPAGVVRCAIDLVHS